MEGSIKYWGGGQNYGPFLEKGVVIRKELHCMNMLLKIEK